MALSTQPYKGARDYYPEDKRLQKWLFNIVRQTAELYGYEEYDAPILEPTEIYLSKGNQEIIEEQTYTFKDRGGRSVTIRTEMTPSVSRMVAAKSSELSWPLRWYSIPNLWRYERPQRGRSREFWQPNIDLFGVNNIEADQEIIMIANSIMKAYGALAEQYQIRINSRELTDHVLEKFLGLDKVQGQTLTRLIDKKNKMSKELFIGSIEAIFSPSQRDAGLVKLLLQYLNATDFNELPLQIMEYEPARYLERLMTLLKSAGISNIVFDPTIMRGFDYYTGMVFEVFDTDPENTRAMFGGGRYDSLMKMFGVEPIPAVGFALGDITLNNFLSSHKLLPELDSKTEVYAIIIGDVYERAQIPIENLRQLGVNIAVDISHRKTDKQLKTALKKGIPYVLFIGEKELENNQFTLKNLALGSEETHSIERIVSLIKDRRRLNK